MPDVAAVGVPHGTGVPFSDDDADNGPEDGGQTTDCGGRLTVSGAGDADALAGCVCGCCCCCGDGDDAADAASSLAYSEALWNLGLYGLLPSIDAGLAAGAGGSGPPTLLFAVVWGTNSGC